MKEEKKDVENIGVISKYVGVSGGDDIDKRLSDLEQKVNPTAKKILSTRAQQILILQHLGLLQKLNEFKIPDTKKAELLSFILNSNSENIRKDLSSINNPKTKIKSKENYTIISKVFKKAGIKELEIETKKILNQILEKEKK